mgnify:CR=1 FL=1
MTTTTAPPVPVVRTSVGKKFAVAASGLIGLGYLIAHMMGNLKLFLGAEDLNHYGEWLRELLVRGLHLVPPIHPRHEPGTVMPQAHDLAGTQVGAIGLRLLQAQDPQVRRGHALRKPEMVAGDLRPQRPPCVVVNDEYVVHHDCIHVRTNDLVSV